VRHGETADREGVGPLDIPDIAHVGSAGRTVGDVVERLTQQLSVGMPTARPQLGPEGRRCGATALDGSGHRRECGIRAADGRNVECRRREGGAPRAGERVEDALEADETTQSDPAGDGDPALLGDADVDRVRRPA